jgi:imidazolonepropionase-like amidohydrolase
MSILRLSLAALLAPALMSAAPETIRYVVLFHKDVHGSEVDTYSPDGRIDCLFEYNDRGRGPKIEGHYTLGADGLVLRYDVTGHNYLKAAVDEHFYVNDGIAHWKSTVEDGHAIAAGFYVSNDSPATELSLLAAALIKAKGAPLKLLPAGEARLERLADATVEDHGRKLHVTEFGITGLDYTPSALWLDDDLRFFAIPGKGVAILREGWEGVNDQLYALGLAADDARYARLARELARRPDRPIAFEHVRLFDSEQAVFRENQTVVVAGERITIAGPSAQIQVPKDAERIDGKGKTLLPGLFDMHVHTWTGDGLLDIASGVTSVRDMANVTEELVHTQSLWDSGTAIGPRVWKAGFIDGRGPFADPRGALADTEEEALAAVNRYADSGFIQIKVYSSLKPELFPAIVKRAHERGLRVSGHVPNGMIARQFVEEGADEIQHINFIFLNFLASKVKDTRTPERFTAVGDYAAKLDLQSKEVNDFIDLLKQHHTTVDVTLATFESMFTGRPGKASADFAPILNRLPAQIQRQAYVGGLAVTEQTDQLYKDSYDAMLRMTKRLYDAGVPILAGTDATAGIMLHRELELEVKAGIPPLKALQIATFNAAKLLKADSDLGSIANGKRADLVLVEGNPAEHISDIRRCRLVMKNGVIYKSADVYAAVGMKPAE